MNHAVVKFLICALIVSFPSHEALAADLIVKGGMIQTSVLEREKSQPIIINGIVGSIGLGFDVTPKVALAVAIQPLVNLETKEISRNSVNGTASFNILGSSRRYGSASDIGTVVYHGGSALSLLARGGVQYYQQYLKEVGTDLKGSTINGMVGAAYRYDIDESQAVGFELLMTAVSFANSTEGLSTKELEIGLFYQYPL
jgi:hypothetical protein